MSEWVRRMQGRPPQRDERERFITRTWLAVRADKREAAAEVARERWQRELPRRQAELLGRARQMNADPWVRRMRAEAARRPAQARRAALRRRLATLEEEIREERARETLRTEYGGQLPGAREAVTADSRGRDIARWAAMGVPLAAVDCSFVHPHAGPCQPRRGA